MCNVRKQQYDLHSDQRSAESQTIPENKFLLFLCDYSPDRYTAAAPPWSLHSASRYGIQPSELPEDPTSKVQSI